MKKVIIRIVALIALFISASLSGFSQSNEKLGSWYIYNGFFNVNPKVQFFFESQLRTWEPVSNVEYFLLAPFFNYNLNENIQVGLGLEYHKSWTFDEIPENKMVAEEFRKTLQTVVYQKVGNVKLQHRYRYEFRDIDGVKNQRMRYRIQVTIPITKKGFDKGGLFINTLDELLIDSNPNLQFNHNRFYVGLGYQFTKNVNLQMGYLNIWKETSTHNRISVLLTHKLYFYDK